ncbi:MAG: ADP-forming succinate--CoA ligase subunit beta, partial [Thermoplasmata archaeon]
MKLFEYQGKEIFKQYGIEVPRGFLVGERNDIKKIDMPFP